MSEGDAPVSPTDLASTGSQERHCSQRRFVVTATVVEDTGGVPTKIEDTRPEKACYIIRGDQRYKVIFDVIILIGVVWNIIFVPFELAYQITNDFVSVVYINLVIDALCWVELFLNFITTYWDEWGDEQTSFKDISRRYASTWLIVDFLACMPFDVFVPIIPEHVFHDANLLETFGDVEAVKRFYVSVVKLTRLFRIVKLIKALNNMGNNSGILLAKLGFLYCLTAHMMACGYYSLGLAQEEGNTFAQVDKWPIQRGLLDAPRLTKHTTALYWAFATLCQVGYGDVVPGSNTERGFVIVMIVTGAAIYSGIFGNAKMVTERMDASDERRRTLQGAIKSFIAFYDMPRVHRNRVSKAVAYMWARNEGWVPSEVLGSGFLPENLQSRIGMDIHGHWLRQIPIFDGVDDSFLRAIVTRLRPQIALSGDDIILEGAVVWELYFIRSGSAKCDTAVDGQVFAVLQPGDYFGEAALVQHANQKVEMAYSCRVTALTHCDLYSLRRETLLKVMAYYPAYYQKFSDSARKRLAHYKRLRTVSKAATSVMAVQRAVTAFKRSRAPTAAATDKDKPTATDKDKAAATDKDKAAATDKGKGKDKAAGADVQAEPPSPATANSALCVTPVTPPKVSTGQAWASASSADAASDQAPAEYKPVTFSVVPDGATTTSPAQGAHALGSGLLPRNANDSLAWPDASSATSTSGGADHADARPPSGKPPRSSSKLLTVSVPEHGVGTDCPSPGPQTFGKQPSPGQGQSFPAKTHRYGPDGRYGPASKRLRGAIRLLIAGNKLKPPWGSRYVIMPTTLLKRYWDWVVVCFVVFTSIFLPMNISFQMVEPDSPLVIIGHIADGVVGCNVFMGFLTAFKDKRGIFVRDVKVISKKYLKESFVIDLAGLIPVEVLLPLAGTDAQLGYAPHSIALAALLKTPRLLRVQKVVAKLSVSWRTKPLRLLKLIYLFCLVGHWIACLLFLVGRLQREGNVYTQSVPWIVEEGMCASAVPDPRSPFTNPDPLNRGYTAENPDPDSVWFTDKCAVLPDFRTRYITSLYFGFVTMSGVGYGDISPQTNTERLCAVILVVASVCVSAIILGNVANIISALDRTGQEKRNVLDQLQQFLSHSTTLDPALRKEVEDYVGLYWRKHKGYNSVQMLSILPFNLRAQVCMQLHGDVINRSELFHKLENSFIKEVVTRLHSQVALPGQPIMSVGDHTLSLYLIKNGRVAMQSSDNRVCYGIWQSGSSFGEVSLLERGRMTYGARALQSCDLLVLEEDDIAQVLKKWPVYLKKLRKRASRRIDKMCASVKSQKHFIGISDDEVAGYLHELHTGDIVCCSPVPAESELTSRSAPSTLAMLTSRLTGRVSSRFLLPPRTNRVTPASSTTSQPNTARSGTRSARVPALDRVMSASLEESITELEQEESADENIALMSPSPLSADPLAQLLAQGSETVTQRLYQEESDDEVAAYRPDASVSGAHTPGSPSDDGAGSYWPGVSYPHTNLNSANSTKG